MKNSKLKFVCILLMILFLSGCTKQLTDENRKVVRYDSTIICSECENTCTKKENEYNNKDNDKELSAEELEKIEKEISDCKSNCEKKCTSAKKNETGQNLTKNILCQPTNSDVVEIYEKYNVDIDKLPTCSEFKIFSEYESLWINFFVRPLAWLIIKVGLIFKNYGLSLVITTLLIRMLFMSITKKTAMQSENLKKAQVDLDRLNKKYENKLDQESQMQKSQEMLLIYKKYDINPLLSLLFAFIQIPLLFAFIEAINRTPAIFEGKFLGLNLGLTPFQALKTGKWWYLILVILLAIVTHFSLNMNKTAGAPGDDTAKQMGMMNKFMLIFIVYASFSMSTAICIYWVVSSAFTVIQNIIVKRKVK